ncbi:MAG TPA: C4-type zinc ribbon domain-containing protein [Candidatus Krumholzibacteria bacterium]|nr:C4-type zinc ribbon domain-containing protein [Candidatus Krumholzibacteria bacterium]HRX52377.1 C4-type zinc ribbon domain-containing protein [Candidatus Krumholzibacteria bacterium]
MNRQLNLLVDIQNKELTLRDARDPEKAKQFEALGFSMDPDKIQAEIDKLLGEVDPRQRRYYERLKTRYSDPVVPVRDGHCTGCYANVPTSFTSELRKNEVQQCESCGRIIFQL